MKLFSNDFTRVDFQDKVSVLETVWMPRSSELSEEDVKHEMMRFLQFLDETKPVGIIADTRYFGVKVSGDLQNWIVMHFMSKVIDAGVKKYAIIVGEEAYAALTGESGEEGYGEDLQVRYFLTYDKAFSWIRKG